MCTWCSIKKKSFQTLGGHSVILILPIKEMATAKKRCLSVCLWMCGCVIFFSCIKLSLHLPSFKVRVCKWLSIWHRLNKHTWYTFQFKIFSPFFFSLLFYLFTDCAKLAEIWTGSYTKEKPYKMTLQVCKIAWVAKWPFRGAMHVRRNLSFPWWLKNVKSRSKTTRFSNMTSITFFQKKVTYHCVQIPWGYINICGYCDQFSKLTPSILQTYIQNE